MSSVDDSGHCGDGGDGAKAESDDGEELHCEEVVAGGTINRRIR